MKPLTVRQFELARGPRSHNIKALKLSFESHGIDKDDALLMSFRVCDLRGVILNSTPSAYLYEDALNQLAYYREMHL